MYEDQTYEAILARCLARVTVAVDKREGSILYDALAPACAELATLYTELSATLDRAFPDTATGEDLDRKAAERAITRKAATKAVRKGTFVDGNSASLAVPIGTRFSGGGLTYAVAEYISAGAYRLTCETAGEVGNTWFGTLLPIDYVAGLAGAELTDVLIPGEDEEDDDSLRARYFDSFDSQAFGGNVADYRERIRAMDGVGGVKVARAPSGGGTVGVTIVASDWTVPAQALVSAVQTAVDPMDSQGEGVGLAPIGHTVTVTGVTGRTVDVALTLTLEYGVTWSNIEAGVTAAIQAYLSELTQTWESAAALTVRLSQVETRVLAVAGVLDVEGTTLNGAAANLGLAGTEIPVLGSVTNGAA